MATEQHSIRRVPLRTLWIKGIRTIWQLRRDLIAVWLLSVVLPATIFEIWIARLARPVGAELQVLSDIAKTTKVPDIIDLISISTPFVSRALSGYVGLFVSLGIGWFAILLIVHRYFQGFPRFAYFELLKNSVLKFVLGGFVIIAFGLSLGLAGVAGFPVMDLVAALILMTPAIQVACGKGLFESVGDSLRLRYAAHFKGGKFLSLVQMAILSLLISTLVVAMNHFGDWLFSIAPHLSGSGMHQVGAENEIPAINVTIAIIKISSQGFIVLLIPAIQMTLYYWLFSIPKLFQHDGIRI